MIRKASKRPPLAQRNIIKRLAWARKYLKQDFSYVIFTDEYRATLDGTDGWRQGWVMDKESVPVIMKRQHGGGGSMFWAALVGDCFVGPYKVQNGAK